MPGRWQLALLEGGEGWQGDAGLNGGFTVALPPGHFARSAEGARKVVGFPKDTPVDLPREARPMRLALDDTAKPETVRVVDPEDLSAVFGEGVRVQAVTEGRVEGGAGVVGRCRAGGMPDDAKTSSMDAGTGSADDLTKWDFVKP
jgi:hypothetical protein